MKILEIKNPENFSPFAPEWNYYILEDYLDNPQVISGLRDIILFKEKEIIKNTPKPDEDLGNTGLGPNSLTSRFPYFNVLEWKHDYQEIMDLYNFIWSRYNKFLEILKYDIPETSIQCWANVLRKGQQIKVHRHNTSPSSFLSGNITIQAEDTKTNYYVSEVYDEGAYPFYSSNNKPGSINIFPSHMLHDTSITESDIPRISIAFDIHLGNITEKKFIKFEKNTLHYEKN